MKPFNAEEARRMTDEAIPDKIYAYLGIIFADISIIANKGESKAVYDITDTSRTIWDIIKTGDFFDYMQRLGYKIKINSDANKITISW